MKTILTLILGCTMAVEARLMETREACLKRYGEPLKNGSESVTWLKGEIQISAWFRAGECNKIIYQKTAGGFSAAESETLRVANANGGKWKVHLPEGGAWLTQYWRTTEGWYLCSHKPLSPIIMFTTMQLWNEEMKATKDAKAKAEADRIAAEKKKLEGF